MPPRTSKPPKTAKPPLALAVIAIVALGIAYFAIQGGEYGTTDLLRQSRRMTAVQHDVDSLQRQVDSLSRWKRAIESDPRVQERMAREEFGMVKGDKEMLYRFAEDRK
jgi:cell division protein FtsB